MGIRVTRLFAADFVRAAVLAVRVARTESPLTHSKGSKCTRSVIETSNCSNALSIAWAANSASCTSCSRYRPRRLAITPNPTGESGVRQYSTPMGCERAC